MQTWTAKINFHVHIAIASLASQTVTQAEEQSGHMSQVSVAPNGETIA